VSTSNSVLHLINTCVLVNIRDVHKNSSKVWDSVASQIENENLKSVRHVLDEVERRWPDIFNKLKPFKKKMLIPDADLYAADVIAEIREIQRLHPGLINPLAGGNPADPFLIAVAKSKPRHRCRPSAAKDRPIKKPRRRRGFWSTNPLGGGGWDAEFRAF
jgi:hypothetical protein